MINFPISGGTSGHLMLGPNIFVMGLIGTFGGYYLYQAIRVSLGCDRWSSSAAGLAVIAWVSVIGAAAVAAFRLALSGTVPLGAAMVAMVGWHALIGVGEALITVLR